MGDEMDKDKSRKLKVHLVFGGGLTLVFLITTLGLSENDELSGSSRQHGHTHA